MANKDLLKQAIAEAKSVREAAIANAKEALEETLTPHLKDLLAAKLEEAELNEAEEVADEKTLEEAQGNIDAHEENPHDQLEEDEAVEEEVTEEVPAVEEAEEEAEDDSEESEDEAEESDAVDGDEDLGDLSVDEFKDMIRDIISQELSHEDEAHDDLDAGDIEGLGDEAPIEEPVDSEEGDEEIEIDEIDLDELLAELDSISKEEVEEGSVNQMEAESDTADHRVNNTLKEELDEALETIESLKTDLQEVNLLNSKLLYVNKIFKSNNLNESQKVNVIAAFDKAETVKEVKLVFETVTESGIVNKKETVSESKVKGMASKATGTTASKPEVISEVNGAVHRMQILAGIKPRQF